MRTPRPRFARWPVALRVQGGVQRSHRLITVSADCHLHIADHQDIMEAVASDEKALEAMRSAALSKLMFFAQRKLEALRTLTSVSHKILQDKAQTLAPLRQGHGPQCYPARGGSDQPRSRKPPSRSPPPQIGPTREPGLKASHGQQDGGGRAGSGAQRRLRDGRRHLPALRPASAAC